MTKYIFPNCTITKYFDGEITLTRESHTQTINRELFKVLMKEATQNPKIENRGENLKNIMLLFPDPSLSLERVASPSLSSEQIEDLFLGKSYKFYTEDRANASSVCTHIKIERS